MLTVTIRAVLQISRRKFLNLSDLDTVGQGMCLFSGLVVIDVVEGTALESLSHMQTFLRQPAVHLFSYFLTQFLKKFKQFTNI
jgi:hypothetical protein